MLKYTLDLMVKAVEIFVELAELPCFQNLDMPVCFQQSQWNQAVYVRGIPVPRGDLLQPDNPKHLCPVIENELSLCGLIT